MYPHNNDRAGVFKDEGEAGGPSREKTGLFFRLRRGRDSDLIPARISRFLGMVKKALGRGLDALISAPSFAAASGGKSDSGDEAVLRVPLERVNPSPHQPRKRFSGEQLAELAESIREHGVIQPLIVRRFNDRYELIAGERRWRACQEIGLGEVPVIVREASDRDVLEIALIENLQREDLNPIEEAEAYTRLAREFDLTQEAIAHRVGKARASVANSMRLLDLEKSVQAMVAQNLITAGHAKAILALKEMPVQKLVADMVLRKSLNVRATEKLVSEQINGTRTARKASGGASPKRAEPYVRQLEDRLRSRFSTNVSVHHGEKKGKIEIEYFGNEDLSRILELLGLEEE